MEKLPRVRPGSSGTTCLWSTASMYKPRKSWRSTSSSATASTACSATPPVRSTASTRPLSAQPPSPSLSGDLDSRDRGQRERLDVLIEREGVWGCTFVGECTRVCPKHVDPAGAIQRYKLKAAKENVMAFLLPGGVMSAPATYRQPVSRLWWTKKRTYFLFVMRELSSIFVAWFAVFDGDGLCHRTWRGLLPALSGLGCVTHCRRGEHRGTRICGVAHDDVVRAHLQAMVVRLGGRRVPAVKMVTVAGRTVPAATVVRVGGRVPAGMVIASQYLGLIVVSAFIAWLVLR